MESSASGVSITRFSPYFSKSPIVARKTPPRRPLPASPRRQHFALQERSPECLQRVPLLPLVHFLPRSVAAVVVIGRMRGETIHLGLAQCRPFAGPGALHGLGPRLMDLEDVQAVH